MMLLLHSKKALSTSAKAPSAIRQFLQKCVQAEKLAELFAKLNWRHALAAALMGVLLIILLLYNNPAAGKSTTLRVMGQHSFRSGQLTVWIDQQLVYQGKISGTLRRHFGVFQKSVVGSFAQTLSVPGGMHAVRVRISTPEGYNHDEVIQADFASGTERTLTVGALRSGLTLSWKEVRAVKLSGEPTWYAKYFRSLLLMVSGSAFSALMGMLVQKFIALVRSQLSNPQKI